MDASPLALALAGTTVIATSIVAYKLLLSGPSAPSSSAPTGGEEKVADGRPVLRVYFGSQTGTAEGLGRVLEREGNDKGFNVQVVDLEDWDEDESEEFLKQAAEAKANVFLMATYGEGEPTDNAATFIKLLKSAPEDFNFPHAVFGLGNTQYEFYNAMGKLVRKKLKEAGGEELVEYGEGDDDKNLEEDFEAWKDEKFWPALEPLAGGGGGDSEKRPENAHLVTFDKVTPSKTPNPSTKFYFDAIEAKVTTKKELLANTSGGANSTKHIEVALPKSVKYNTADNAGVIPHNPSSVVSAVASHLSVDPSATFTLKGPNSDYKGLFPTPCTVGSALAKYVDLLTPPKRSDLKLLAKYASPGLSRDFLNRLASKDGKSEYEDKIKAPYVGIAALLTEKCPDVKLTFEDLINVAPRLQPRYYTISSSSTVHPKSLHMTVAITKGVNPSTSAQYTGVCSGHMSSSSKLDIFVKESSFKLPSNDTPIIMVGPGTGVAPMRALLQERVSRKAKGRNVLFFGCRRKDEDWLYRDEMEGWAGKGQVELFTAFSREQKEKVYVQNVIEREAAMVKELIVEGGAWVYVCGATSMGADVVKKVKEVVGEEKVKRMQEGGMFIQELWA